MKNIIYSISALVLVSVVTACQPKIEKPGVDQGTANFSKYVSIGDGTPAGYSNGAVNLDGQLASFPKVLAEQFKKYVGGGEFNQPLVDAGLGYGFEKGVPATKLKLIENTFCDGKKQLYAVESGVRTITDIITYKVTGTPPYNNMAAHATRAIYVNRKTPWLASAPIGGPDTFWKFFAPSPSTKSILAEALDQSPTFFTIYLGSTDVFRFAKSGGNQEGGNDDEITPVNQFRDSLKSIVGALTAIGAKGAIINLIDVESFPYFRYRKYDDLVLTAEQAAALNIYWANKGASYEFHEGRNAYVIEDPSAGAGHRRVTSDEYICIQLHPDSVSIGCTTGPKWGSYKVLPKRWVLDHKEIKRVNDSVDAFNVVIKEIADQYGLAFVNSNENMKKNLAGTHVNGIYVDTEYGSGGIFSLDGLNLSPRGQVLLANQVIDAINKQYGSTIPFADPNKVVGVNFGEQ